MVVRRLVWLAILFLSIPLLAEHAGPASPPSRATVTDNADVAKKFIEKYRDGRLGSYEREAFLELLAKKSQNDRDFILMLMRVPDEKMRQAFGKYLLESRIPGLTETDYEKAYAQWIYLLVTDARVAGMFNSPLLKPTPAPPRYEGPSMSAAPKRSEWEKRWNSPLEKCYRQCAHDKIYMYGPWWGLNPGGGPYWACMSQCNWDYKHGKLY